MMTTEFLFVVSVSCKMNKKSPGVSNSTNKIEITEEDNDKIDNYYEWIKNPLSLVSIQMSVLRAHRKVTNARLRLTNSV